MDTVARSVAEVGEMSCVIVERTCGGMLGCSISLPVYVSNA